MRPYVLSFVYLALGLTLSDRCLAGESASSPIEGAVLMAAPTESILQKGEIILKLGGAPVQSLPAFRAGVLESIGKTVAVTVLRDGAQASVQWTPPAGTYTFAEWPTLEERFRRAHPADDPDSVAGRVALKAVSEGSARSAARNLERTSVKDPLLSWARAWVLIRFQAAPSDSAAALDAAKASAASDAATYGDRIKGLSALAAGYLHLAHGKPKEALDDYKSARNTGADATELARAIASALGADGNTGVGLLEEAFQDDPLNLEQAQLLARIAPAAKRAAYVQKAALLSGGAALGPAVELAKLVAALPGGKSVQETIQFVKDHPEIDALVRADALEAVACAVKEDLKTVVALRADAFLLSPNNKRVDALVDSCRRAGTLVPALEALLKLYESRTLRVYDPHFRPYMTKWIELSREAYLKEGKAVEAEAARLNGDGKTDEAVALLKENAVRLALPELNTAAGIILQENGKPIDTDVYFRKEFNFYEDYCQGNVEEWMDSFGYCLLFARTGYPKFPNTACGEWMVKKDQQNAAYWSVRAAMENRTGNKEDAKTYLTKAANLLKNGRDRNVWMPVYAMGKLCETTEDFVRLLNEKEKLGIQIPDAGKAKESDTPGDKVVKPPAPPKDDF
jgi:hypothetical protein